MDELQAGVEQPLAVFPQPPVFLQPRKAALHHPALGHDLKGMQFAALGDLHRHVLCQDVLDALRERLAHIALRALSSKGRMCSNFSGLMSLGYFALMEQAA